MNKDKLKKIAEELRPKKPTEGGNAANDPDIGGSLDSLARILDLFEKVAGEHTEKNATDHEQKFTKLRRELMGMRTQVDVILNTSLRREREVNQTALEDLRASLTRLIDGVREDVQASFKGTDTKVSEIAGGLESIRKALPRILNALSEQTASQSEFRKGSDERSGKLEKRLDHFTAEHSEHRTSFQKLFDYVAALEEDLKKKLKNVYEFGVALQFLANGSSKGVAGAVNFKNGTNTTVSVTPSAGNVGVDVQINVSAIPPALIIPTGTVDNINTAFVFSSKPVLVYVNGIAYRENHGWTWNSGSSTATLASPVGTGGDIYGV